MIRVSALYPAAEGATFDHEYYHGSHMPMVVEKLKAHGMVRAEVDRGLAGMGGSPPPLLAAAHLIFSSLEDFQKAFDAVGQDLLDDIPNYTNIQPQIVLSEMVDIG